MSAVPHRRRARRNWQYDLRVGKEYRKTSKKRVMEVIGVQAQYTESECDMESDQTHESFAPRGTLAQVT